MTDCPNVTFMIDHECSGIPQDDKLIIQFKHSQNAYSRNKYTQKENFLTFYLLGSTGRRMYFSLQIATVKSNLNKHFHSQTAFLQQFE